MAPGLSPLKGVLRLIDLHTHSNISDGSMTPAELVAHAKQAGLQAMALTDHDSMAGVPEALAAGARLGLEVVPGVELSAKYPTEVHVLGYYPDMDCPLLQEKLEQMRQARERRTRETAEKLQALGFAITAEDAAACAGGKLVGRAHFAKAMVAKGQVGSVKEAFDKYLGVGRPAYSHAHLLTPVACVRLIRSAGGVPFVAHVHSTKLEGQALEDFLLELKAAGLAGIEGYYSEYTPEMGEKYRALAARLGLALSGGSDFHGTMKPHIAIGRGLGDLQVPYSLLERLRSLR